MPLRRFVLLLLAVLAAAGLTVLLTAVLDLGAGAAWLIPGLLGAALMARRL